jgi:LPS export ABC transporter protein LptC
MHNADYIRMENGTLNLRFEATVLEHFDGRQTMRIENISFEQFQENTVDITGHAGTATIELESRNIVMEDSVTVESLSENMTIETEYLDWKDSERKLSGTPFEPVHIQKSDGTDIRGQGFSAQLRTRTVEFSAGVEGTYGSTAE